MKKISALIIGLGIACLLCSCVLVPIALVGGGVVGGLAISEDTVQTEFDQSYDDVWDASVSTLDSAGIIEMKDKEAGRIQGYVPKSKVTVQLEQLTPKTVRVQVKARKAARLLPDIKMAHRVAYRIGMNLKESPAASPGAKK